MIPDCDYDSNREEWAVSRLSALSVGIAVGAGGTFVVFFESLALALVGRLLIV